MKRQVCGGPRAWPLIINMLTYILKDGLCIFYTKLQVRGPTRTYTYTFCSSHSCAEQKLLSNLHVRVRICTTRRANQEKTTILSSPLLRLFGDQFPIILRRREVRMLAKGSVEWSVGGQNRSFMNIAMSSGLASQEDCNLSQL